MSIITPEAQAVPGRFTTVSSNVESCDRLVGAMLIERHETWVCEGKHYIALDGAEA